MWVSLFVISFVAFVVLLVLMIIWAVRKKNVKKMAFGLLASFAIIVLSSTQLDASDSNKTAADPVTAATVAPSPTDDTAAKAEADKKAQEEAEKKVKEEADKKAAEAKAAKEKEEADKKAAAELELFKYANAMTVIVPSITEDAAELESTSYAFLSKNNSWFPAVSQQAKTDSRAAVDPNVTSRHLFKNIVPYYEKMIQVTGDVVQVQEENTDIGTLSTVHILDENGNSIIGVLLDTTGDLLDGDVATLYGLPVASYSFDNVGGGTTNAIMLACSEVVAE